MVDVHGISYDEWPLSHRKAYELAETKSDSPCSNAGLAADWAPETHRGVKLAWGLRLEFARRRGLSVDAIAPGEVSPEDLKDFICDALTRGIKYATMATYVRNLGEFRRVTKPGADYSFIGSAALDLDRAVSPSPDDETSRVGASTVYKAAFNRMERTKDQSLESVSCAGKYLDGLKVALGTITGVRLRTLALTDKRHFILEDGEYKVCYEAHEVKTRKSFEGTLPRELTPYIDHGFKVAYWLSSRSKKKRDPLQARDGDMMAPPEALIVHSKTRTGSRVSRLPEPEDLQHIPQSQPLWVTRSGKRMSHRQTYTRICKTNLQEVDVELGPQQLRRLGPTSLHRFAPGRSHLGPKLLQHAPRVNRDNYVKCNGSASANDFHRLLVEKFGKK